MTRIWVRDNKEVPCQSWTEYPQASCIGEKNIFTYLGNETYFRPLDSHLNLSHRIIVLKEAKSIQGK